MNFNNWVSIKITEALIGYPYDKTRIKDAKVAYFIECLINGFEKTIILLTLFGVMGKFKECLICYVVILLTRTCIGGIHMRTWIGCTIMTIGVHLCAVGCGMWVDISSLWIWIFVVAFALMVIVAPLPSPQRPNYRGRRKMWLKFRGCTGVIISFAGWSILNNFGNYILWVLLLEIIEVVCAVLFHAISQMMVHGSSVD